MYIFFSEGRLGNQLFQYQFLDSFVKKNKKVYCFGMDDLSRTFTLQKSNIRLIELSQRFYFLILKLVRPIFQSFAKIRVIGYLAQEYKNNRPAQGVIVRSGLIPITFIETHFFQSECFKKSPLNIRIKNQYLTKAHSVLKSLGTDKNFIFVHVRRGDYLKERFNDKAGIELPVNYYKNAINMVEKQIANPLFIFMSDDIEFVKENFSNIDNKYISSETMMVDFALMTLCDGGICSNSSFSWWGASLIYNKLIVLMPRYWYGWKSRVESHVGIQPSWAQILDI